MTTPAGQGGNGVMAASGVAELGAEAQAARTSYGEGALVVCDRVVRIYTGDGIEVQALQGLDLVVQRGELTALVGASGSGKSTLINILAGLDVPTAGTVKVAGRDIGALGQRERLDYRRRQVGFIWQQTSRNLLPYLTAAQNVAMALVNGQGWLPRRHRRAQVMAALEQVGIAHLAKNKPARLSGGEQQRVAVARALVRQPKVLLADEPTGALDTETGDHVIEVLHEATTRGCVLVLVTHDWDHARRMGRVLRLDGGTLHSLSDAELAGVPA